MKFFFCSRSPVAYRIAGKPDWSSPDVLNLAGLRREERMFTMGPYEDKESAVTQVSNIRQSSTLPATTRPFRNAKVIAGDEFLVDLSGVLTEWNLADHIEEVTLGDT